MSRALAARGAGRSGERGPTGECARWWCVEVAAWGAAEERGVGPAQVVEGAGEGYVRGRRGEGSAVSFGCLKGQVIEVGRKASVGSGGRRAATHEVCPKGQVVGRASRGA